MRSIGDSASGGRPAQLDRIRTHWRARSIICFANYFFITEKCISIFRGVKGLLALGVNQRRHAGRAQHDLPRLRRPACAAGPHQDSLESTKQFLAMQGIAILINLIFLNKKCTL